MHNLYRQFRQLLPEPPLQAGIVTEVGASRVVIALPGGGLCAMASSKARRLPCRWK